MNIVQTIHFHSENQVEPFLDQLDIDYQTTGPLSGRYMFTFQISEEDPRWLRVKQRMQDLGLKIGRGETVFNTEEILNAPWLRMLGFPQIGYPQPERRWQEEHFNYADRCPKCGSFRQVSSFFIKKEPKLRRWDFMSLFWTSAVFAVPRVFTALEAYAIQGYERWPVYIYKSKEPSNKVAQLYLPHIARQPALVHADDLEPFVCEACGALKYKRYHSRGVMYLRKEAIPSGVDFFQTYEWFIDGLAPWRERIVSNRVAQLAYAEKWRGVTFKVVELV